MPITLQALVDTACLLAKADGVKRGVVAELLVPRVLTWVGQRAAANPARRALVTDTHTILLTNGVGVMPANALVEFMELAAVSDPLDATMARKMRWIPDWREFVRPLDLTLGYFTASNSGNDFVMTRPGAVYTPGSGYTGNIDLTVASKPAVVTGAITTAPEIEQDIVAALTAALKGNWEAIIAAEAAK